VLDDQPVVLQTRSGPIVNVPYTQECNDVAMMLIQHHKASEYADRAIDQFEQLKHDARNSARVMAIVLHPYIMGAPHRLKYFRKAIEHIHGSGAVLFWTGEQILDWYKAERVRSAWTDKHGRTLRGPNARPTGRDRHRAAGGLAAPARPQDLRLHDLISSRRRPAATTPTSPYRAVARSRRRTSPVPTSSTCKASSPTRPRGCAS
jgi:hypothetical protein